MNDVTAGRREVARRAGTIANDRNADDAIFRSINQRNVYVESDRVVIAASKQRATQNSVVAASSSLCALLQLWLELRDEKKSSHCTWVRREKVRFSSLARPIVSISSHRHLARLIQNVYIKLFTIYSIIAPYPYAITTQTLASANNLE